MWNHVRARFQPCKGDAARYSFFAPWTNVNLKALKVITKDLARIGRQLTARLIGLQILEGHAQRDQRNLVPRARSNIYEQVLICVGVVYEHIFVTPQDGLQILQNCVCVAFQHTQNVEPL